MSIMIGDIRPHKYLVMRRDNEIIVIERSGKNSFKFHRWGGDEDDSVYTAEYSTEKAQDRIDHYRAVGWTDELQSATTAKKLIDKLKR